jgi:hypothetical protein
VLETEPDRTEVLDASAELLAELGDVDGAKDLLLRSAELSPNTGHAKYVLLGHLEHGARAVECFEKGYDLLKGANSTWEPNSNGGGTGRAPHRLDGSPAHPPGAVPQAPRTRRSGLCNATPAAIAGRASPPKFTHQIQFGGVSPCGIFESTTPQPRETHA